MTTRGHKLWKRAEKIVSACRAGSNLCRYNRQTEAGSTEVVFFLEPGGKQVGRKSAENAISSGLLACHNDGLFGADTAQSWGAAQ